MTDKTQLIADQTEMLAHLGDLYPIIEAMADGFTITTDAGDYTISPTDAGLAPWLELARAHLDDRCGVIARTIAGFTKQAE